MWGKEQPRLGAWGKEQPRLGVWGKEAQAGGVGQRAAQAGGRGKLKGDSRRSGGRGQYKLFLLRFGCRCWPLLRGSELRRNRVAPPPPPAQSSARATNTSVHLCETDESSVLSVKAKISATFSNKAIKPHQSRKTQADILP